MDELKLENFFEKDKSGHVVRKGDLDLLLLYMATKIDEIVHYIKDNRYKLTKDDWKKLGGDEGEERKE